jgi:hypothetical protein
MDECTLFGFYFDREGDPIDLDRWVQLQDDNDYGRVGLDVYPSLEDVADHPLDPEPMATVSTVWIGINHRFGPGDPLIFETMVFGGEYDEACARYSSEAQAAAGHARAVADLRAGRPPWWLTEEMEAT